MKEVCEERRRGPFVLYQIVHILVGDELLDQPVDLEGAVAESDQGDQAREEDEGDSSDAEVDDCLAKSRSFSSGCRSVGVGGDGLVADVVVFTEAPGPGDFFPAVIKQAAIRIY